MRRPNPVRNVVESAIAERIMELLFNAEQWRLQGVARLKVILRGKPSFQVKRTLEKQVKQAKEEKISQENPRPPRHSS